MATDGHDWSGFILVFVVYVYFEKFVATLSKQPIESIFSLTLEMVVVNVVTLYSLREVVLSRLNDVTQFRLLSIWSSSSSSSFYTTLSSSPP